MLKILTQYKDKVFYISKLDAENLNLLKATLPKKKDKYTQLEKESIQKYNNFVDELIQKGIDSKALQVEVVLDKIEILE